MYFYCMYFFVICSFFLNEACHSLLAYAGLEVKAVAVGAKETSLR